MIGANYKGMLLKMLHWMRIVTHVLNITFMV